MASSISLLGYCDRLSGRPGDVIEFKVSSTHKANFDAKLVRVISADPNPEGAGIVEEDVTASFAGSYPSREQPFYPGSYVAFDKSIPVKGHSNIRLEAKIWPTMPGTGAQTVLCLGSLQLLLNAEGCISARLGDEVVATTTALKVRKWYHVWLTLNRGGGALTVGFKALDAHGHSETDQISLDAAEFGDDALPTIAAEMLDGNARHHFNGKIEAPTIYASAEASDDAVLARWDFSQGISTTRITDTGPHGVHGRIVNLPARGMTGASWDASEMCWRHAPEQYGAIHFHENDIYDFGWEADFSFTIPDDLPSGIYAARISCEGAEDAIPFFVLPAKSKRTADLCVLVSTFTYAIYGNHARPDYTPAWDEEFAKWSCYPHNPAAHKEYGLSTYNYHKDGSGICHASHKRPLFNMKPGYRTFPYGPGSGLRHFQADSHLISWLHNQDIAYDIVTDQELHDEGVAAIQGYKCLTTGSHPEYHTSETLDALENYRDTGGKLVYLGGNGFYWKVALHGEEHGAIEIRRAETGIRAWAAEPGEYYNAFDGTYGGIWRRNGRPPQALAGVGFSAQGQFEGSYYRCKVDASDPDVGWIVAGIDGDVLGDFGFSGGGAAGFELDRVDTRLGTPENVRIVASSENHSETFVLVPEEHLTHITNWPGEPVENLLRADMIYYDVPGGGAVFSTGSITFCGSLPWNNFDNNISKLMRNVFDRFLSA
ncbi:MAG: N,N-dimethylformamidase beta subunit family domain-containing protein [Pseudomonadota bacterium]